MTPSPPAAAFASRAPFAVSRFWRILPAGMRRRWWLFRLFDLMARHLPVPGARRGVLVVRMDGIGDMVLFRHSLEHYAEAFGVAPADITVLGCKSWASIAGRVFAGYRVIIIDEHAFAKRPFYRFAVGLRVRWLNAQVAVCDSYFRRVLMGDSLVWLSAAPRRVVALPYIGESTRPEYAFYLSQCPEIVDTGAYPAHEIERHAAFVSALLGRPVEPEPPRLEWAGAAPPIPPGDAYVVVAAGANEPGRRWPFERYQALARRLNERGLRVVLVGGAGERPGRLEGASEHVLDLVGRTGLPELMDLLKGAAGVLANDTGPAHLAIALGAPTVVVGGGGHFGCFVPYPQAATPATARFVHAPMDCYHCFWRCDKRRTDAESFPCVSGVGEDAVWDALEEVMGGVVGTERMA